MMEEYDLTQKSNSDMLKLIDFRLKQIEDKLDAILAIMTAMSGLNG